VSISERDRPLINALLTEENTLSPKKRHICNGRFLTMHKRRRKKLTTRSLAFEPAIIDDILHGQVNCILKQVGNWRFNAFTLETVTGGELLSFYLLLSLTSIDREHHFAVYCINICTYKRRMTIKMKMQNSYKESTLNVCSMEVSER
jgi:hypothetical protein